MMTGDTRDPFEVLGIEPTTDEAAIKAAYRSAAKSCHPDVDRSETASARFLELTRAFDDLKSEPDRLSAYKRRMASQNHSFGSSSSFDKVFDFLETHGRGTERRPQRNKKRGGDKTVVLTISLERAFSGGQVVVPGANGQCLDCAGTGKLPTRLRPVCPDCGGYGHTRLVKAFTSVQSECRTCHGQGAVDFVPCGACAGTGRSDRVPTLVDIPPGCQEGYVVTVEGRGDPGKEGGPSGDLVAKIAVAEHPKFRRFDEHLEADVEITVWDAALGGKVEIIGIDGRKMTVTLPPGSQPGTRLSLRGQGMPAYPGRGNLVAVVRVVVPAASTPEVKAAYAALASAVSAATNAVSPASPIS